MTISNLLSTLGQLLVLLGATIHGPGLGGIQLNVLMYLRLKAPPPIAMHTTITDLDNVSDVQYTGFIEVDS